MKYSLSANGIMATTLFSSFCLIASTAEAEQQLQSHVPSSSQQLGSFNIAWDANQQLVITADNRVVWESKSGQSFVSAGIHNLHAEENRGSFIIEENLHATCSDQTVEAITLHNQQLEIRGKVSGDYNCKSDYTLTFEQVANGHLQFKMSFDNAAINYSALSYASSPDERFHGFGAQFSLLDLKGSRVPVISQEGGVGRGHAVISTAVDIASPGSGGNELTTYYAVPQYISSNNQSLFLENTEYAVFDLTEENSVQVELFNDSMTGRILNGNSMLSLIERFTEYSGRMSALPDWFNEGAIVGMQGGTEKVTEVLNELKRRGTPIAGFWLQDWVGKRETSQGSQLWWNWELDKDRYPNWNELVDSIEAEGGKMLCYINPFLVDATEKGNVRRNLYAEAVQNSYLVKKENGEIYAVTNTDFDAGMVDLTNPDAATWIKNVIKDQLMHEGRCYGWMHDFAEALPFDAVLYSGEDAASYHNQYPVEWAKTAHQAIEEAGLSNSVVFFNRAGSATTPSYSTLIWGGDQLVTWDKYDGFKTAITSLLTGGFSGIALNHSDIGGYTNATVSGIGYNREQELLLRWMEMSAFTPAYRTHEGLQPENNAQFYDNDTTYSQFDRFARVYKALAFYRKTLFTEMSAKGWPVVRHPMLHYPDDSTIATLTDHMMLGSEILIAPIVNKNTYNNGWKKVYFPDADNTTWVNIFTGQLYGKDGNTRAPWWLRWSNPAKGNWEWVYAPVGSPAAFYKQGSSVAAQLEQNLLELGVK